MNTSSFPPPEGILNEHIPNELYFDSSTTSVSFLEHLSSYFDSLNNYLQHEDSQAAVQLSKENISFKNLIEGNRLVDIENNKSCFISNKHESFRYNKDFTKLKQKKFLSIEYNIPIDDDEEKVVDDYKDEVNKKNFSLIFEILSKITSFMNTSNSCPIIERMSEKLIKNHRKIRLKQSIFETEKKIRKDMLFPLLESSYVPENQVEEEMISSLQMEEPKKLDEIDLSNKIIMISILFPFKLQDKQGKCKKMRITGEKVSCEIGIVNKSSGEIFSFRVCNYDEFINEMYNNANLPNRFKDLMILPKCRFKKTKNSYKDLKV